MLRLLKKTKRFFLVSLAICLFLVIGLPSLSSSAALPYDPEAALAYAKDHYNDNDSKKCAEFVADCLNEGGLTSVYSWPDGYTRCPPLREYLLDQGWAESTLTIASDNYVYSSANSGKISTGDAIFWHCETCGTYEHAGLCGGVSAGKIIYYAHNDPVGGKALLTWPCGNTNGNTHTMILIALHTSPATGRINVDFSKDGAVWNSPSIGSAAYAVNTATGTTYSMTQNPDYLYAYRTADTLPYGTYNVYVKNGTGSGASMTLYSTVTLNASNVWVRPNYYTLSYTGNGSTSGSAPTSAIWLSGKAVTVAGQSTLAKSGYTFSGWKTAASSGTSYAAGSTITMTAKTTLYAQWTQNKVATVSVLLNGSAWSSCRYSMELHNVDTGAVVPLYYSSSNTYTTSSAIPCGNYDVYAASSESSTPLKTGDTFTLSATNTSTTVNYYYVAFYRNGGTGTLPSSRYYTAGMSMLAPSGSGLTRNGYTFCYWMRSTAQNVPIIPGVSYEITSGAALYAKWFEGGVALGDINTDGVVDTTDARLVQQHAVEKVLLTDAGQLERADYNCDGDVDTTDARLILQASVATTLATQGETSVMGNIGTGQIGTNSTDSVDWDSLSPDGSIITWDDLNWDLLDMDAIDWDTITMEEILRILLGQSTGNGDQIM